MRSGPSQLEALNEINIERTNDVEFVLSFNTLSENLGADFLSNIDHRSEQFLFDRIFVDISDDGEINLHILWFQVSNSLKASIARPDIIHRQTKSEIGVVSLFPLKEGVVFDGESFGNLKKQYSDLSVQIETGALEGRLT